MPNEGVIRLAIDENMLPDGNYSYTMRDWCDYYFWDNIYATKTTSTTTEFVLTSTTTTTSTRRPTTTTTTTEYRPSYKPPSETSCFQDLTDQNQDMVKKLGYQIHTWHGCKVPSCPWPEGSPNQGQVARMFAGILIPIGIQQPFHGSVSQRSV